MNPPSNPAIGSKSNKVARDASSWVPQLDRQRKFLKNSARLYDEGYEDEAIRMATTLRVLLHDTSQSTSLLTHLGVKKQLKFIDTGLYRDRLDRAKDAWISKTCPGAKIVGISPGEAGLVEIRPNPDGTGGFYAPLRENRFHPHDPRSKAMLQPLDFDSWWRTPLVEASSLRQFSRENLILIMANQDGGAHVDAHIDIDYRDFMSDFLGHSVEFGGTDGTMDANWEPPPVQNNVAFASVRQIAWEIETTLDRHKF
ncbi:MULTISPECIES: hypothetical protein [Asticcacaulis]|uniref:hypothetical protein n=1 Tax=Asticcacaulis TaxID=76890 RepID=UPI001AE7C67F|nr:MULTISPECIES: hypothetical protein [Asticcacaulis]MBP2158270.1 hypothetical protein [Asticcacaulis solisilvae]MDR6799315.1 hypothetical protein [Asticcacaulis sp. BE141]